MRYTVTGTLRTYARRDDDFEPVERTMTLLVSAAAGLSTAAVLELALIGTDDPEAEWAPDVTVEPESPSAVMRATGAPRLFDEATV